jgi:hypothetical protein
MKHQASKYKKIGIIGEHPNNDSTAMIALLRKYLIENVSLEVIDLVNFRGSLMDSPKFNGILASELRGEDFDFLIVLRDLDFGKDKRVREKERIVKKDKWFTKVNKDIGEIGIFFLIIYELEALMLCDIEELNRFFQTKIVFESEPIKEKDPKGFLQKETKNASNGKYEEKDAEAIFKKLSFQKLYQNHTGKRSFKTFADELKEKEIIEF